MKRVFLFLCFAALAYSQDLYNWKVIRVIDGDTVEIQVDFLPKELGNKLHIRIWGVDTPEKGWRAQSQHEQDMGNKATDYTRNLVQNAKDIKVSIITWDKYGGRVLGDLIIDGQSLRKLLLQNGYAREYYGAKKESWDN
jgi:micrococcal nuclease